MPQKKKNSTNNASSKIFLIVIVVAVIGAFLVFRSFAATNNVIVNAEEMVGGKPIQVDTDTKSLLVERQTTSSITGTAMLPNWGTTNVRFCINARPTDGESHLIYTAFGTGEGGKGGAAEVNINRGGWISAYVRPNTVTAKQANFFVNSESPNVGIRQVMFVKNSGDCPK